MPVIRVDMLEGRSVEQRRMLARELTDAFVRSCGGDPAAVRVLITEIPDGNWSVGGELIADRRSS